MTVASFVAAQRTEHGVAHAKCCRWLGVAVKASFDDSGGAPHIYGLPRVFEDLVEAGWKVSVNTVAESMARQGLQGRSPKRKRRWLTRPDKAADPIPDVVRRDFSTGPVDQCWCGDLDGDPHQRRRALSGDRVGPGIAAPARVGSALDNAASESWNSTLEHEQLSRNAFETKEQARRAVARFIDAYNTRRRHSSCEGLPPVTYEKLIADRSADQQRAA